MITAEVLAPVAAFLLPTPNATHPLSPGSLPLAPFLLTPLSLYTRLLLLPTGPTPSFAYTACALTNASSPSSPCASTSSITLTLPAPAFPSPPSTLYIGIYLPPCDAARALAANAGNATPPLGGAPIVCPTHTTVRVTSLWSAAHGGVLATLPEGVTAASLGKPFFSKMWLLDTKGASSFVLVVTVTSGKVNLFVNSSGPPSATVPSPPPELEACSLDAQCPACAIA